MQIGSVNQADESTKSSGVRKNLQDPRIKSIQEQINNVRKQLNELSANENLTVEQKRERRKQLNEQIKNLTERLTQTQMQIQQENMKKASQKSEEKSKNNPLSKTDTKAESQTAKFTEDFVMLDLSMNQMKAMNSIKVNMKGQAKVLESEIKMDRDKGVNTEYKEKELADIKNGITNMEKEIGEKSGEIINSSKSSEKDEPNPSEKDDEAETKKEKEEQKNYSPIDIKL